MMDTKTLICQAEQGGSRSQLKLGRILFADETSPYIKKFGKGGELYKAQLIHVQKLKSEYKPN